MPTLQAIQAGRERRWPSLVWPPPIHVINDYGLRTSVALALPTLVLIYQFNLAGVSEREREWQKAERERKLARLRDMISILEGLLQQEDHIPGGVKPHAQAIKDLKNQADKDQEGPRELKVRFVDLFHACNQALQLDKSCEEIRKGYRLSGKLLERELTRAIICTKAGKLLKYKSGERLKELLRFVQRLYDVVGLLRIKRRELREMRSGFDDLWDIRREGRKVLRRQMKDDVVGAVRLILLAKRHIFLLFVASCMAAVSGMTEAVDLLLRAESLETLRRKRWDWADFRKVLQAWITLRCVRNSLDLLTERIRSSGQKGLENTLRTSMYASMLSQDFEWYRLGQRDERDVHAIFRNIFDIPNQVKGFIAGFTSMIEVTASAASQAAIIRKKSSGLLYALVGLEWTSMALHKVLAYLEVFLKVRMEREAVHVDLEWVEPLIPANLPTVRASAAEARTLENWEMFWNHTMRKENQKSIVNILLEPVRAGIRCCHQFGAFIRAGQLIKRNQININEFEALTSMSSNIAGSARRLIGAWDTTRACYGPLARSWDIVSVTPSIGLQGGIVPAFRAKGDLAFEDVHFEYPDGPGVIHGMSWSVSAGTTCALTGASGSGKSTFFKLIERFYDPSEGTVLLDGMDIRTLNPVWVRKQISAVEQKPKLFSLTLRENLTFGCDQEPQPEEIEEACRNANIYDFVFNNKEKFPAGLYTHVSGHTMSGGELQRIAIARALLRDTPILLLDEATSSLDSHSQKAVKSAIANLMKGRTVLTIAHRLETIKDSDIIMFLKAGKITEKGSHAELVSVDGHYAKLYQQQVTETMVAKAAGG